MQELHISVQNRIAIPDDSVIVCSNTDYKVIFNFDSEWEESATKTLRVVSGEGYEEVVFSGHEVVMPQVQDVTECKIGCYSGNLKTTTPAIYNVRRSILSGDESHVPPTPDVYAQILEQMNSKQGKLTAGQNITITEDNVISASGSGSAEWGLITGEIQNQTDLAMVLASYADEIDKKANKTYVDDTFLAKTDVATISETKEYLSLVRPKVEVEQMSTVAESTGGLTFGLGSGSESESEVIEEEIADGN